MSRALDTSRPPVTERELMDALIEAARWRGWLCCHTWNSEHSAAGFPDVVMVRGDRCIVVECKSAQGVVSAEQRQWLDAFVAAGIPAYVIYPAGEDWFLEEVLV